MPGGLSGASRKADSTNNRSTPFGEVNQILGWPGVAGVHHGAAAGCLLLYADAVRLDRVGDSHRAYQERSDLLAGLPGMPVELLGKGGAGFPDLAVGACHLVRPGEPRGRAGWGIDRTARPRRVRRIARCHVVAAQIQTMISMQVTQRYGIDLMRVDIAVERSHGAWPAVHQQREDSILVWRLQQVAGGWRVRSGKRAATADDG